MIYFAYGSNLNLDQMEYRCPNAKQIGPAILYNWKLAFRGPLDIEKAKGHQVPGFLFKITDTDLEALDRYEGFPWVYTKENITVFTPSGRKRNAFVYTMVHKRKQTTYLPGEGYLLAVIEGYKQCGLADHFNRIHEALEIA